MVDVITKNLDLWSSAIINKSTAGRGTSDKQTAYGIKKLRELILELAVRGKLVPQETDWRQTCLGDLGEWAVGSGFPKSEQGKDGLEILFAKVSDMNLPENEKYIVATNHTISKETAKKLGVNVHASGTVIFPKIGGAIATNKRRILTRPTAIDNNCLGITPKESVSTDWLYLVLSGIDFTKYQAGTSVPALSQGTLAKIYSRLPPLAEQHRIVAKVDELIALCDQLEQRQTDNIAAHQTLVQTLLDTLTQAADAAEFEQAWSRIADHFDTLFTTEPSIDQLKQTLLQLAVMGKLVTQDPSDEPARILLEKIDSERTSLGITKKQKGLSLVSDEEKTFQIPKGWVWVRLQQIIQISSGDGLTASNMDQDGKIPVFGGNGITGYHNKENVSKPTLVIGRVGYYCGSVHITPKSAWITDNAFITKFSEDNIYMRFLYWLLKGTNLKENENATAQPVISGRKLYPIVVGLPPKAEQHRIVAKVDELMSICDTLKARIAAAQTTQIHLADAIVEQAVA